MKRSRFSEEQIIGILREQEAGSSTADVCRKHGVSSATFIVTTAASARAASRGRAPRSRPRRRSPGRAAR